MCGWYCLGSRRCAGADREVFSRVSITLANLPRKFSLFGLTGVGPCNDRGVPHVSIRWPETDRSTCSCVCFDARKCSWCMVWYEGRAKCHTLVGGGSGPKASHAHDHERIWRRNQTRLGRTTAAGTVTRKTVLLISQPRYSLMQPHRHLEVDDTCLHESCNQLGVLVREVNAL